VTKTTLKVLNWLSKPRRYIERVLGSTVDTAPVASPSLAPAPQPIARAPSDAGRAPTYTGWCRVCGLSSAFRDMARPIRETYQCTHCKASMRERVTASAILAAHGHARALSLAELCQSRAFAGLAIYEPGVSGAFRRYLKPLSGYVNSFYWEGGIAGQKINDVRHEDLQNLSFPDDSFDLVISSDIFEHIRRPWEAFREVARVLKPGGMHIFSIPALNRMPEKTTYRVDTSGPQDVHILDPHYHGDGRGGKSLVYTDFGSDYIDSLAALGFRTFTNSDDHTDEQRLRVIAFTSLKV
jgi:SAM-dependent methyltransferase